MQKSYSTYLSGSLLHEVNDCDIFKVHTCVGMHFGAYFAFWSWVAGAVAGCRRRVPLQGAAVRVLCACGLLCSGRGAAAGCRFKVLQSAVCALELGCCCAAGCCCRVPLLVLLQWQASPGAVQGAKLLFIVPLRFQDQKGLGGLVCL